MTRATLRSRLRRLAASAEESAESEGELSLVPFLDIVTNVLMFLFASVSFSAAMAAVPARQEARSIDGGAALASFQLRVRIGAAAVTVEGDEQAPSAVLPLVEGRPDAAALARVAGERKSRHPEARIVEVRAAPSVPYEAVIEVVDAVRGSAAAPLFPDPLLVPTE